MLICGTAIDSKEIIGIGPMFSVKKSSVPLENKRQLYFTVYLKHYSVQIESSVWDLGYGDKVDSETENAREAWKQFVNEHKLCYSQIENKIKDRRIRKQPVKPKIVPIKKSK